MLVGIGLAIVGFVVVIVVCAVILALLAAILPSYESRTNAEKRERADKEGAEAGAVADDASPVDPEAGAATPPPAERSPAPEGESDPAA